MRHEQTFKDGHFEQSGTSPTQECPEPHRWLLDLLEVDQDLKAKTEQEWANKKDKPTCPGHVR